MKLPKVELKPIPAKAVSKSMADFRMNVRPPIFSSVGKLIEASVILV